MKTQITRLLTALVLCASLHRAVAQGTAFTYQGRLNDTGLCADGFYQFWFFLYNVPTGGSPITGAYNVPDVLVTNGLFTVLLDFGSSPNPFNGTTLWLQTYVRTN